MAHRVRTQQEKGFSDKNCSGLRVVDSGSAVDHLSAEAAEILVYTRLEITR